MGQRSGSGLWDEVSSLIRHVGQTVILPRFENLGREDVAEKSPGDLVTTVDHEAEAVLTRTLLQLLPGSQVIGEERASRQPGIMESMNDGDVWLVDPLDGTTNFVEGNSQFAVMVALLQNGTAVSSWMYEPCSNTLSRAELGAGAFRGDRRVRVSNDSPATEDLRGAVLTRFLPAPLNRAIQRRSLRIAQALPGTRCAAIDYPMIAEGTQDFAMFWRTLSWDHSPGALFLTEAGGMVARFDGSPYIVSDPRPGLIAAATPQCWNRIAQALLRN